VEVIKFFDWETPREMRDVHFAEPFQGEGGGEIGNQEVLLGETGVEVLCSLYY
jgi:hypothetical protein